METAKKQRPPDKRPRFIDPNARIFPVEAGELVGISRQQVSRLCQLGELPQPSAEDGRFPLKSFLTAYVRYVERAARKSATAETAARVKSSFLQGL
jgi:hypothetical protein